jgi:hypothetical protein
MAVSSTFKIQAEGLIAKSPVQRAGRMNSQTQ